MAENNPVYQSEQGALYDKEAKTLLCYPGGKTGNVTIPLGVVKVEDYAFSGCASIKSVELPERKQCIFRLQRRYVCKASERIDSDGTAHV